MANFCTNCGNKINPGAKFCPHCGNPIAAAPAEIPEASTPPSASARRTASTQRTAPTQKKAPAVRSSTPEAENPRRTVRKAPEETEATAPRKMSGKTSRKKKKRKFLGFVLAVAIIAEFFYAGFKKPGFLLPGGKEEVISILSDLGLPVDTDGSQNEGFLPESTGGNTGISDIAELSVDVDEALELLSGLTDEELKALNPGNPKYIQVRVDENDLNSIPPETAQVSPEFPVASFGDGNVVVNMKPWNLDGEDTLEFREVGTRYDGGSGRSMHIYDFELASGIHEFPGVVEITMPRPQDGHADGVLYFNREAGVWEPTCYEISEDGCYYTLLTDHFCMFCTTASDFCTIEGASSEMGKGIFCAAPLAPDDPYALSGAGLGINPGVAGGTAEIAGFGSNAGYNSLLRPLQVCDDRLTLQYLNASDSTRFLRTLFAEGNLKEDTCIDYGFTSFCGMRDNVDAINTLKGLVGGELFAGANKFFAGTATALCALKIMYLASKGEAAEAIFKECGLEVTACLVALKGLTYAALSLGSVLCCIAALGLYFLPSIITEMNYADGSFIGGTYRYYLDNLFIHGPSGQQLTLSGSGWAKALTYTLEHCDPRNADAAVEDLYNGYLNSFWNLSSERQLEVAKEYNHRAGIYSEFKWNRPDPDEVGRSTERARGLLRENTREIVKDVYKKFLTKYVEDFKRDVNEISLPYLNTYIVINATDSSVSTFDKSLYAIADLSAATNSLLEIPSDLESSGFAVKDQNMVTFAGVKKPVFWPANMDQGDYPVSLFRPVFRQNSNQIFACRRYYYMMYGAPKTLDFAGHPESGAPQLTKTLSISSTQLNEINVNVSVNSDIPILDGDWWQTDGPIGETVIRFALEDSIISVRINTADDVSEVIRTADYTQSKEGMTINAPKLPGGKMELRFIDSTHIEVKMDGLTRNYVKEDGEAVRLRPFLGSWFGEFDGTQFVDLIAYREGHVLHREFSREYTPGAVEVDRYVYDESSGTLTLYDSTFRGGSVTCTLEGEDRMITTNGEGLRMIFKRDEQANFMQVPMQKENTSPGIGSYAVPVTGGITLGGD